MITKGPNLNLAITITDGAVYGDDMRQFLRGADALTRLVVQRRDLAAPPASPANGAAYIVAATATGAWAGKDNQVAVWTTDNPSAPSGTWEFYAPQHGWQAFCVADEALVYCKADGTWTLVATQSTAPAATVLNAVGDSITVGVGASTGANGYAPQASSLLGFTLNSVAVSGTEMAEFSNQAFSLAITPASRSVVLPGVNDANNHSADTTQAAVFKAGLYAVLAHLAIPDALKKFPFNPAQIALVGTWTNATGWGGNLAKQSGAAGDTATATLYGSVVYVCSAFVQGNPDTFQVIVDGTVVGTFNTGGLAATAHGQIYGAQLIRVAGLAPGAHTVQLKSVTAASGNYICWMAGNEGVGPDSAPVVYCGDCLSQEDATKDPAVLRYNQQIHAVVADLQDDGLNVVPFAAQAALSRPADYTDNLHPNDQGHRRLASALVAGIKRDLNHDARALAGVALDANLAAAAADGRLLGYDAATKRLTLKDVATGGGAQIAGDLGGTLSTPKVAKLQGVPVDTSLATEETDGYVLTWDNTAQKLMLKAAAAGSGGGSSTVAYVSAGTPDAPPANPTPIDDEFTSAALNAAWTMNGGAVPAGSAVPQNGALKINGGGCLVRPLNTSGAPFEITAKFVFPRWPTTGGNNGFGLVVQDGGTHAITLQAEYLSGVGSVQFMSSNLLNWGWNGTAQQVSPPAPIQTQSGQPFWLRIKDDGTNLVSMYSLDGVNFVQLWTSARLSYLQASTANVGIYIEGGTYYCDYFRRTDGGYTPAVPATVSSGGAVSLIAEHVCSGGQASFTFSSIPQGYRDLRVVVRGRGQQAATFCESRMELNGDTGANYDEEFVFSNNTAPTSAATIGKNTIFMGWMPAASSPGNEGGRAESLISNYRDTLFEKVVESVSSVKTSLTVSSGQGLFKAGVTTWWRNTAPVTSITVHTDAGNFVDGTVLSLYGIY